MTIANTYVFNKCLLLNTPPPFDGERFESWKARMKFFVEENDFEMWEFFINGTFILSYCIDNKVVHKPDFIWTKEDKRKLKLGFKVKYLMMTALSTRE